MPRNRYVIQATPLVTGLSIPIPDSINSFYYADGEWGFSVRTQQHRNGRYWYAYKRIKGHLHKHYLCSRPKLTDRLLRDATWHFKAIAVETMTEDEFKAFDEAEFNSTGEVIIDPVEIAVFDAWLKDQGLEYAA